MNKGVLGRPRPTPFPQITRNTSTWTVSLVPSCLGTIRVVMVNTASSTDSVPARMPQDSMPRRVLLVAYLAQVRGE